MNQFEQETAITEIAPLHYAAELYRGWRIGKVPNGGYVLAIIGRALRAALPHRDPLTVNAFYLAPTRLGPVECRVEVLRRGRNTSHAMARLYQDGELKVQVTAAYVDIGAMQGESWAAREAPDMPPMADCFYNTRSELEFHQRVDLRLASGSGLFNGEGPDRSGEFSGYLQHRDGAPADVLSLLLFADAFPPPAFSLFGVLGWVPTVDLSVQVRAHPAPGPLQARLYSRFLTRGVVEEDGEYWDSNGTLVALSRQTALVRVPNGSQ
ncbi:MAG: thioesterase family protein [Chromatocurvus sp.]